MAALRRAAGSHTDHNGRRPGSEAAATPEAAGIGLLWQQHAVRPCPSDTAQLGALAEQYGEDWVCAAIASLGERAPIGKPAAVRVTLERWQREDSWGSPPPQRSARTGRTSPAALAAGGH